MQTHKQTPAEAKEKITPSTQLALAKPDPNKAPKLAVLQKIVLCIRDSKYAEAKTLLNIQTPSPFNNEDISQLAQWLAEAKFDFPKLFLTSSAIGKTISTGKFPTDQSPILTSLESHPRLDQIIRQSNFPPEQMGYSLFKAIQSRDKKLSMILLKSAPGPRYDEMEDRNTEDDTEYNNDYGTTFAAYCDKETGNRPLHLVCAEAKPDDNLISALIERGAFLTDRNKKKVTPLSILLDTKVDMYAFLSTHFPVLSPEHIKKLILAFCMRKLYAPAKHLIQLVDDAKMPLDLYYVDRATQNTILQYAVDQNEDFEFTKLVLLHCDQRSLCHSNVKKEDPLFSSIERNNDAVVKLFINHDFKSPTPTTSSMYDVATTIAAICTTLQEFGYKLTFSVALTTLTKNNKIDLAIELLEKRPDTKVDYFDEPHCSAAHYAAKSNHPNKLKLLTMLCEKGIDLELKNQVDKSPLSILVERKETDIIAALFKDYSKKFSPNGMKLITACLIISKKDLNYLSIYLTRMQENLTYDLATKQRETKELIFSLIDMAATQKDVEEIISTFKVMEQAKKTEYLSQATSFFSSAPAHIKEIYSRAQGKIDSLALFQNPLIKASLYQPDAKAAPVKTLFSSPTADNKQAPPTTPSVSSSKETTTAKLN